MRKELFLIIGFTSLSAGCISIGTYEKNMSLCMENEKSLKEKVNDLQAKVDVLEADVKNKDSKISDIEQTYQGLIRDLKEDIVEGSVGVATSGNNLTITVGDAVLFKSGSADLQDKGRSILAKVSNVLKDVKDRTIRIDGHTDNVPISGNLKNRYPTNWELSSARAASVARFLEELKGIDPAVLMVAAFSDTKPAADNGTPEGRAQNRRVEITLVPLK